MELITKCCILLAAAETPQHARDLSDAFNRQTEKTHQQLPSYGIGLLVIIGACLIWWLVRRMRK